MDEYNTMEVNEIKDLWGYIQSIDWTDPWLGGLILFHIAITITSVLSRRHTSFQVFLFLALILMVYCSESINEWSAKNWSLFSRQQYFDSKGLFISVIFSIPILINSIFILGSWLYQSTLLVAKLKTIQLKERIRQEKLAANKVK